MARYEDIAAPRRAKLSADGVEQAHRFERSAKIAVQVMELRALRGMTQAQLATATGITQADISRIERGSGNPTEKTLDKIAEALDAELRFVPRESLSA